NLDPLIQEEVKDVFREHREKGGSMVLSTHLVSLAEELCDRVVFLKDGEIIDEVESPDDLNKNSSILRPNKHDTREDDEGRVEDPVKALQRRKTSIKAI
ncbi:ABC transporter-related protein, partial [Candidatus Haloredivivus sp. G17]